MADAFLPVVINATAFISAQYKQVLSGIKTAAAKLGRGVRVYTEDGFDTLDTFLWPKVIIAGGSSLPFLHRVIERMEKEDRRVVLAGTDSDQFGGRVRFSPGGGKPYFSISLKDGEEKLKLIEKVLDTAGSDR